MANENNRDMNLDNENDTASETTDPKATHSSDKNMQDDDMDMNLNDDSEER